MKQNLMKRFRFDDRKILSWRPIVKGGVTNAQSLAGQKRWRVGSQD